MGFDPKKRLQLGQVVATPGALAALVAAGEHVHKFLVRHVHCDWGDVDEEDWRANDLAFERGERVLSAYRTKDGTKLWIITEARSHTSTGEALGHSPTGEADRPTTTILLPHEY